MVEWTRVGCRGYTNTQFSPILPHERPKQTLGNIFQNQEVTMPGPYQTLIGSQHKSNVEEAFWQDGTGIRVF